MKKDISKKRTAQKTAAEPAAGMPKLKQGNFLTFDLLSLHLPFNAEADDGDIVMLDRASCKLLDLFQYLRKKNAGTQSLFFLDNLQNPIEPKDFPACIHGFNDSVRIENEPVAGLEPDLGLLIIRLIQDAEGKFISECFLEPRFSRF
jgi:hypothetical protein